MVVPDVDMDEVMVEKPQAEPPLVRGDQSPRRFFEQIVAKENTLKKKRGQKEDEPLIKKFNFPGLNPKAKKK